MNCVTGRSKKRHTPKASLDDLSQVFGDIVTDPNRPPELQAPSGPLSRNSFTMFKPVAIADIAKCLGAVDPYKATGSDGVPGVVLRNCADIIAPHLAMVINSSFSMATVTKIFKCSHVCPLFKSGDKSSPRNYRPVSLLPIASRILEYFVKEQLTDFLSTNGLYPTSQFAYRKQHSTEDALILATNRWQLAKSEKNTPQLRCLICRRLLTECSTRSSLVTYSA